VKGNPEGNKGYGVGKDSRGGIAGTTVKKTFGEDGEAGVEGEEDCLGELLRAERFMGPEEYVGSGEKPSDRG